MSSALDTKNWRLDPRKFSKWQRLKRVRAWVNRFIENCSNPELHRTGELSVEEIQDAELQILISLQRRVFAEEIKMLQVKQPLLPQSKLLPLNPFLDDDGLLRANSRLFNADYLAHDVKFPVILPRGEWETKLVVRSYHEKTDHIAGTNHILALLSEKYWIIRAREEIRQVTNECNFCKKKKAKAATQIMAPLPDVRVSLPLQAFSKIAVDFGGPFTTIQGRGKKRVKRYMCLFTCLLTRAVHIEMAYGLDTDSFLNAFYRMTNRQGLPKEVISDNGTNFIGASQELKELIKELDQEKVTRSGTDLGIKWRFNPPLAPHFGGAHESMIKAAKKAVLAVLGNADVTDEELSTAFTGAESLINSRPLTYQSANASDYIPLTLNHFLHGKVGGQFVPKTVDEKEYNPRKCWRRIQELVRHFWQCWLREWLPSIGKRTKWYQKKRNIAVDDIVLVMSPDTPRGKWPLGQVIEVFPRNDGHVRSIKVCVNGKNYIRPIVKVCPIDLVNEEH